MPLLSEDNRRKRNVLVIAGFLLLVGAANLVDIGVYAPDLPLASNITSPSWCWRWRPRS
ncbi:MAG: hypothetical protein HYU25_09175 [Candidatus Rokubacteria bacterium]|nr:hypothetical protein [Candidatus Rokubacteria bacterium]